MLLPVVLSVRLEVAPAGSSVKERQALPMAPLTYDPAGADGCLQGGKTRPASYDARQDMEG